MGKKIEGYCFRCKKKVLIKFGEEITTKNNMRMWKGICPNCGTSTSKILGKA